MASETNTATPGASGETATPSQTTPSAATQPGAEPKPGEQPKPGETQNAPETPQTQTQQEPKPERTFTQTELSALIAREVKKEADKWQAKAEEAKAEASGEWKTLAENRKQTIDTMQTQYDAVVNKNAALVNSFSALVLAEITALPAKIRAAAPIDLPESEEELQGMEMSEDDLASLAKWLPKGKALAGDMEPERQIHQGTPPRPPRKGGEVPQPQNQNVAFPPKRAGRYSM